MRSTFDKKNNFTFSLPDKEKEELEKLFFKDERIKRDVFLEMVRDYINKKKVETNIKIER